MFNLKNLNLHRPRLLKRKYIFLLVLFCLVGVPRLVSATTQSGSVGLEGTISSPAPNSPATITIPVNGQVFTQIPIKVSGLCKDGLLVKLFKNNVFSGSVQCSGGSYSITTDLFSAQNELVARVYDNLDQAGPDSKVVTVTFNDSRPGAGTRPTLTSNFAKRGANPNQTLLWPITLSGGDGPYAISVDWGDGKPPDLLSQAFPGTFDIKHIYDKPGAYNIIVKAVDRNELVAYLQMVGIANGPLGQDNGGPSSGNQTRTIVLWQPAAILLVLIILAFWLGNRYKLKQIRENIKRGDRPF